jgi:hypothetical protein
MPIKDRNLKPGTKLIARYRKQDYACEVLEGEAGKLRYCLGDGKDFKSISAAGMAITGKSCNGWAFWGLPKPEPPAMEEPQAGAPENAEALEQPAAMETRTNAKPSGKHIFRIPNQKGVPEGQTRWFCHECSRSFLAAAGITPWTCPERHRA